MKNNLFYNMEFYQSELRERFALSKVISEITSSPDFEYDCHLIPHNDECPYDLLINVTKDGSLVKRYLIESKIRKKSYDTYMLELSKYKSLQRSKLMDDRNVLLYINFTPQSTYIWNLDDLKRDNNLVKGSFSCPKKSCVGDRVYISKDCYLLDIKFSTKLNYIYDEKEYLNTLVKLDITKEKRNSIF